MTQPPITGIPALLCFGLAWAAPPCFAAGAEASDVFALDLEQLAELEVVTASRLPQAREHTPALVTVFTRDEIRGFGFQTLAELLEYVPEMQALSGINSNRLLAVRGTALQDGVLVLVNGLAVNNAFLGNFNFYDAPLRGVERVEILRGPGSALFGGNALLAVVNIQTRLGEPGENLAHLGLGAGDAHGREHHADAVLDLAEYLAGLRVAAGYARQSRDGDERAIRQDSLFSPSQGRFLPPLVNPSLAPAARREHPDHESAYAHAELGGWKFRYQYFRSQSTPVLSSRGVVTEEGDSLRVDALNALQLSYAWEAHETVSIFPKLYYTLNQSKTLGDSEPPQYSGDVDQDGFNEAFPSGIIESYVTDTANAGTEVQLDWRFAERQHLSFGAVKERTWLAKASKLANVSRLDRGVIDLFPVQDMTGEFIDRDVERRQTAYYAEYFWQAAEALRLTAGARHSRYSDFAATTTPRFSVVYTPTERLAAKFLYGEAFKPANFIQLFDRTPALSPFRIQGNPGLQPTEIRTAEAQLSYRFSSRLEAGAALFRSRTDNEIAFDGTPGLRRWQNIGAHRTEGGSLELAARFERVKKLFANYSYQKSRGLGGTGDAQVLPRHRINAGAVFTLASPCQLFAGVRYFSRAERERGDARPGVPGASYADLSFQCERLGQDARLELTVKNVFDKQGRDPLEPSFGVPDDMPRAGRTLWLGLELPLR